LHGRFSVDARAGDAPGLETSFPNAAVVSATCMAMSLLRSLPSAATSLNPRMADISMRATSAVLTFNPDA